MTTSTARLRPASSRPRHLVQLVVVAVAGVAALVAAAPALRVPAHVEDITIENPHPWPATVTVTPTGSEGAWHRIGTVDRDTTQAFHEVVDHGERWTLRFDYLGHHADVEISRTRLQRDGWRVTVPDRYADRLRAAGVSETPG